MEDMAIKYNARLTKLKQNIERLNALGMSTIDYSNAVAKIEDETNLEIKKSYADFNKEDSNLFLQDSVVDIYTRAIKSIEKIDDYIVLEYDNYYRIKITCEQLESNIKNVDDENIDRFVQETLELLGKLRTSTSINYEIEKSLVEKVYQVVYKMMRLELVYRNASLLLNKVKSSRTDSIYISELIKEDIAHIGEENKNADFITKIQEVEKNSFDSYSYLDEDVLILLNKNSNADFIEEIRDKFFKQYNQFVIKSDQQIVIKSQYNDCLASIDGLKIQINKFRLSRLRKQLHLLFNLGLLGCGVLSSIIISRNLTQKTEYETTTTTYDSSDSSIDSDVEFRGSTSNSISLVEYSQWEEPGYYRDKYKRNVYRYDLSSLDNIYDDLEDYLNPMLKDKISISEEVVETTTDKPSEQYSGSKYVITKKVQDKSVSRKVDRPNLWSLSAIFSSVLIISIDLLALKKLSKTKLKDLRNEIKDHKLEIKEKKQKSLTLNKSFDEVTTEMAQLRSQLEHEYDKLPIMLQKDKDIKEKVLVLKSEK